MRRLCGSVALIGLLAFSAACASTATGPEEAPAVPDLPHGWKKIPPQAVDGLGDFQNSPRLAIDGKFLRNQTLWNAAGCVWWTGVQSEIVVDLGKPCTVGGLSIQLSSNNDYEVQSSVNGYSYRLLCQINHGEFHLRWGMETVSSLPGLAGYVPAMAFQPVTARYLKLLALGGVNEQYAVSEIEAFGACEGAPGP